jgi:hypothetical protein
LCAPGTARGKVCSQSRELSRARTHLSAAAPPGMRIRAAAPVDAAKGQGVRLKRRRVRRAVAFVRRPVTALSSACSMFMTNERSLCDSRSLIPHMQLEVKLVSCREVDHVQLLNRSLGL